MTQRITLKKFKSMESLSEETLCFTADVYLDGRKWAEASNYGHGGPTDVHPLPGISTQAELNALDQHFKDTNPKIVFMEMELDDDLESVIDNLANALHFTKLIKADLKKKIMGQDPETKLIYQWGRRQKGKDVYAKLLPLVRAKHPTYVILNELPIEEAIVLYKLSAEAGT
jgi:hypothetical protein